MRKRKSMPERGRCFSMGYATLSGPVAVEGERLDAAARNSVEEKEEAEGRVRLLRARGTAELREVASGSATQGLWLKKKKVGSQVSGVEQNRFPGRRTVGEVRRGGRQGRRASDTAEKRVHRFWV